MGASGNHMLPPLAIREKWLPRRQGKFSVVVALVHSLPFAKSFFCGLWPLPEPPSPPAKFTVCSLGLLKPVVAFLPSCGIAAHSLLVCATRHAYLLPVSPSQSHRQPRRILWRATSPRNSSIFLYCSSWEKVTVPMMLATSGRVPTSIPSRTATSSAATLDPGVSTI